MTETPVELISEKVMWALSLESEICKVLERFEELSGHEVVRLELVHEEVKGIKFVRAYLGD